ncbi:hypothetical protein BLNAU_1469 [Blattamonas nauphoetae]|uniref:Uncharacterized protein n=1 Tax=Blattamonas nauphoetae TaxID=2049346 RepID=A0ABQ9YI40_9EUKA|nr:hypothetical protein BLNAU_1469 [Blattamonas nauphoetae]
MIVPSSPYMAYILQCIVPTQSRIQMVVVCNLTVRLFDLAVRHTPTMQFLLSSSVPLIFPTILSEVTDDYAVSRILTEFSIFPFLLTVIGGEVRERTQDLVRMLRSEGLEEGMEQKLMDSASQKLGSIIRERSSELCNQFGWNGSDPE